jgi:hypothetical protein
MSEQVNVFTPPASPPLNPSPAVTRQVEGTQATPPSYTKSPQERFADDQAELARRDPWMRDPSTTVMTRDKDGNVSFRDRTAGDSAPPKSTEGQAEPPKPGHAAVADNMLRLVGQDGKEFTLTAEDISGLMERRALEESRKATLPADASGYEVKLPDGFAVPHGVELKLDTANPAYGDLKAWAHKNGLSQQAFSDVIGIYGAYQAKETAQFKAAADAEIAKLGSAAGQRIDAVATWWSSMTGDDGKVLGSILRMAPTEGTVKAFERMMRRWSTQGGGSYSGAARSVDEGFGPQKVSDAEYEAMTYTEKKQYAEAWTAAQQRRR